jgi:hypothetical protein
MYLFLVLHGDWPEELMDNCDMQLDPITGHRVITTTCLSGLLSIYLDRLING